MCMVYSVVSGTLRLHGLYIAQQAPLSMGFSRQDTGLGCHSPLQGIFPTQKSNPGLLHWQADSLPLAPPGKPYRVLCAAAAKSLQSCLALCDCMDYIYSPAGSSIHEILQARYWVGLPFPPPGNIPYSEIKPRSPALAG